MVLGLSTSLTYESPEDWAKKHKELGCKAVVFPLDCNCEIEKIDAFKKAADEAGLIIAEVGVWRNTLAADEAEREIALDYAVRQLKMADRIGAKCCVNIVGTSYGPRWDGGYAGNFSKEAFDMAVEMVQYIIDTAKPVNTKYSIETMPWMIPSSPDEYLELIRRVDREEFGVHLDFINMVNCPERYFFADKFMEECFDKLHGKILSCHLKDVKLLDDYTFQLRECACGEGSINIEKYAELATIEDEKMPMIIEHLSSDDEYRKSVVYVSNRISRYML